METTVFTRDELDSLAYYLSTYIQEELERGNNDMDSILLNGIDAFIGGAR
jgi:hypothetical protein